MNSDAGKTTRARFRFKLPCPVYYSVDDGRGQAHLFDISPDGVRVAEASRPLAPGSRTRLSVQLREGADPLELEVEVTRQTETGFAGCFVNLDKQLAHQLWDGIAAAAKARLSDAAVDAPD